MIGSRLFVIFLTVTIYCFSSEACTNVEIVSKAAWNAREPIPYRKLKLPVEHIIIAHTVTPECRDINGCSARMRSMQNYHMNELGLPDIGYNYVIGGDGRVYEGTGYATEGTHTRGFNSKSLGISFIGDYSRKAPTDIMIRTAKQLIICGIQEGFISKDREVHGARDATCTISPGDGLYNIIKTWPQFKGGRLPGYTC